MGQVMVAFRGQSSACLFHLPWGKEGTHFLSGRQGQEVWQEEAGRDRLLGLRVSSREPICDSREAARGASRRGSPAQGGARWQGGSREPAWPREPVGAAARSSTGWRTKRNRGETRYERLHSHSTRRREPRV